MAKPKQPGEQGNGKVKIRVIEFEVEGSDSTMQESLKSITAALNRGMTATQPPRSIRYSPHSTAPAPIDQVDGEDVLEEEASEEEAQATAPAPRLRQATVKKLPTPKVLEISFVDVSPTLKEFVAEKSPKSDLKRYLVIAYWFKHHKGTPELTSDHFFTAYRHMQWQVPRDPGAPIRDLRHKKRTQMGAGSTPGTAVINHVGENIVIEMTKDSD